METTHLVPAKESPRLLANPLHTAVLILILLGFSAANARSNHIAADKIGRIPFYLTTMGMEFVLVAFVAWGTHLRKVSLRELIGGRWANAGDVLRDFGTAVAFWFVSAAVLVALGRTLGLADPQQATEMKRRIGFLVPRGTIELMVWLLLSVTAGFCEEVIFRGYLQRQFAVLSSRLWVGVLLQGILFGASHAYEGRERMLLIAVYGVMFGVLAALRKSTRPGMLAHAWQDMLAGFAARFI